MPAASDPITPAMRDWVSATVPDLGDRLRFARIGGGRSNLTYLATGSGPRRAVLRRPPLGELLPSAHDMVREHRIIAALQGSDVPVPAVLGLCADPAIAEHPFYLMEHVDGVTVDGDEPALALARPARRAVGIRLAQALAALHDVDIDAVGLGDLGRRDGYAERQIRRWSRQWELTRLDPIPAIDAVAAILAERVAPEPSRPTLVHGDYNLANVIVGDDGAVRAVLDWELCTIGHPLADVGTLLSYWPDTAAQATLERDPVPLLDGFVDRAELVAAYRADRPDVDPDDLRYWTALASWKLAIILQGVYRRWLENPANGGRDPGSVPAAVRRLASNAATELGAPLDPP